MKKVRRFMASMLALVLMAVPLWACSGGGSGCSPSEPGCSNGGSKDAEVVGQDDIKSYKTWVPEDEIKDPSFLEGDAPVPPAAVLTVAPRNRRDGRARDLKFVPKEKDGVPGYELTLDRKAMEPIGPISDIDVWNGSPPPPRDFNCNGVHLSWGALGEGREWTENQVINGGGFNGRWFYLENSGVPVPEEGERPKVSSTAQGC